MRALVLATQNAKKQRELQELCAGRFAVKTLQDIGAEGIDIVEDGATFAANARIKVDVVAGAIPAAERANVYAVLGDDSGLAVDALDGKPGVRSARFALDHGVSFLAGGDGDAANNALLLALLEPVPDERRTARFVAHIHARVLESGATHDAFGTVEGKIARSYAGSGGFGYDPLFLPDETPGKSMAELGSDEKHAISHRGRAMRAILEKL